MDKAKKNKHNFATIPIWLSSLTLINTILLGDC